MLRNVLEDYLNSIVERDFDYPLMSLLQAMGFYDIHFTHGAIEFGKDFIAKKVEGGIKYQYAIQSKKGNISQGLWRNEIRGQVEEAIVSDLSHPQFSTILPRKVVLVTTGRLTGNARLAAQEFKTKLEADSQVQELVFWEKEQLIQFSEEFGLSGVHQNTAKGLAGFAQFYLTYSKAMQGILSDREIEEFSRLWLDENLEYRKRILRASIEAEIIAAKLIEAGQIYGAITIYLSLGRLIMATIHKNDDAFLTDIFTELVHEKITPLCKRFFHQLKSEWVEAEKSMLRLCLTNGFFQLLHYLVWCARALEIVSLYFFLTKDKAEKDSAIAFLDDLIEMEEGCGHITSDRYAVSLVWPTLAFVQASELDKAIRLVKRSVVWLCDKVEKGFGIARYEADEYEETAMLLGPPFDFIKVEKNGSSYLATALGDLAAFIGDKEFYADVVNDIEACEIAYEYWQFPDTDAIFTIDTEECVSYPNITHYNDITVFEDFEYAEHIKHEASSFQITKKTGLNSLVMLSVLLKDRYFPKLWRDIIVENAR